MGREAKLRREQMKARILAEIGEWTRAATPEEPARQHKVEVVTVRFVE